MSEQTMSGKKEKSVKKKKNQTHNNLRIIQKLEKMHILILHSDNLKAI